MIRPYSERLGELNAMIQRLLLNFRTADDRIICDILCDIADTKLDLRYSEVDFLFHYFNFCDSFSEPSHEVVALLISLNAKVTVLSRDLYLKKFMPEGVNKKITDNQSGILRALISVYGE